MSLDAHVLVRALRLAVGFLGAVVLMNWLADRTGLTLFHFSGSPKRAELLHAYQQIAGHEDVLMIGSSRVQSGIIAQEAGPALVRALGRPLRFHQLGLAGLRPTLLADVLASAVLDRPPRRLLVIAIEERFFCRPEGESGEWESDVGRRRHVWWLRGVSAIFDLPQFVDPALETSAAQIAALGGDRFTVANLERRLRWAGQERSDKQDLFDLADGVTWHWTDPDEPDALGWQRCLRLLSKLDCPILFVKMPVQPGFEARYMPAMQARFEAEILAEISSRGWEYVALQGPPWPSEPESFIGQTHLDFAGARRTTRLLVEQILVPRLR